MDETASILTGLSQDMTYTVTFTDVRSVLTIESPPGAAPVVAHARQRETSRPIYAPDRGYPEQYVLGLGWIYQFSGDGLWRNTYDNQLFDLDAWNAAETERQAAHERHMAERRERERIANEAYMAQMAEEQRRRDRRDARAEEVFMLLLTGAQRDQWARHKTVDVRNVRAKRRFRILYRSSSNVIELHTRRSIALRSFCAVPTWGTIQYDNEMHVQGGSFPLFDYLTTVLLHLRFKLSYFLEKAIASYSYTGYRVDMGGEARGQRDTAIYQEVINGR